jgi:hypothetical protein
VRARLSASLPGATHDLTPARTHDIVVLAGRHRVTLFADKGYIGAGPGVITRSGRRKPRPDPSAQGATTAATPAA